jgi:sugar-specific transcriptional regulator TrmB
MTTAPEVQDLIDRLETEADERDMPLSGYIVSIIERHWQTEDVETAADQANVEERVEAMVSAARDDLTEIAEDIEQRNDALADAVMKGGTYSIANFELLKRDFPDAERKQYLKTGSRRLRGDDVPDPDLDDSQDDAEGIGAKFLRERNENSDE